MSLERTKKEYGGDAENSNKAQIPTINLPKGGGAIHGIGEKFAANPVTGTGSMSVPIATSPGRSGFGPQLLLSYDSGAGNGPFGFGWSLSIPVITRKTDKGLPQYHDFEESDVYLLSGTEDLVPALIENQGTWQKEILPLRMVDGKTYTIQRYRPRIEGLFARIERWTNHDDVTDIFWRTITKDNITSWYGKTGKSRISDPSEPGHIFSWLICESYDDKGNVIAYQYAAENSDGVALAQAHEKNRSLDSRTANRYLKTVRYGNIDPYFPTLTTATAWPTLPGDDKWMFEVVLDYGEHDANNPLPREPASIWPVRNDPFSSYRAGFEIRTYRLCRRVLMFHHFPGEQDVGLNCLVRSTDFTHTKEKDPANTQNPIFSFLLSATQTGYKRNATGGYLAKSLPPVEFTYTQAIIDETIQEIDAKSVENLPYGLDGLSYQWIDLDGEGLSGILTEQADGWFYKHNISANQQFIDPDTNDSRTTARFSPAELVTTKPNAMLTTGHSLFMDLAGDGQTDLVTMEPPVRGFRERTNDGDWEPFQTFTKWPNIDTRDPNVRFVDLTGDGLADILISEDQAFVWHASLAESGFEPAQRVQQVFDEEKGPHLVFADSAQAIFLADMSGDGLTDIVRIRNGEVCYWPNLGYCRFGTKVTMDNSPWFDSSDLFDERRIRLADIDGSGVADIIYLGPEGVRIYYNQSGNGWSNNRLLPHFPHPDNLAAVSTVDLLGNGTTCLVWSSPLPGNIQRPMRYIDLMGGQKPHLLYKIVNNLGAETHILYGASTKFYLQDKDNGNPWITKLPFPVHCVEKVTVTDKWRKTSFSTSYSYHHGYFDGIEREFRGFGRVEQVDVESYGKFAQGNTSSPYITDDKTLYQPPVKTTTWYHTGAFLDRERILSQFEHEYFPYWLEDQHPGLVIDFRENQLPPPDLATENLTAEEWREALRACKGIMLRQEVVELDIDALERTDHPEQLPVKLFSTAYHNCHIRRLQPMDGNRHAVFLVAESEAITYHYELDIREEQLLKLSPDPRIAHTLNLQFDDFANVLQSVAVAYPRLGNFADDIELSTGLTDALPLIHRIQKEETHLAYAETRYTTDFGARPEDSATAVDNYRLRMPCEVLTYELTGIKPASGLYFSLEELRAFQLSQVYQNTGTPVSDIAYQLVANRTTPEKRLVEHTRTLFFKENLIDPLPFGEHGRLGLTFENYTLALTRELLDAVFIDPTADNKLDQAIDSTVTARDMLNNPAVSGYLSGTPLTTRFASVPAAELTGQYWIRSGIAGFAPDAGEHFYLPERYTDSFGNTTALEHDAHDLFVKSSTDALGNTTTVTHFDYRVLAPREMRDINDNLSEVYFDVLGLPASMALKGKGSEGDNLTGLTDILANPESISLASFFNQADLDEAQSRIWLGNATARHLYHFGETHNTDGTIAWSTHPACACGILREQHVSHLAPGEQSPLQAAFEYSDGMGSVLVKKIQAEPERPGQPMRWIANGKTILNNKGKPVKQYEPYFSPPEVGHRFEEPHEAGVTSVIYYDAVGRTMRTEMPDGSFNRVEFSPWHMRNFDRNDTVMESQWYADRNPPNPNQPLPRNPITGELLVTPEQRAAWLAAQHRGTPSLTILDSLGRNVINIADNGPNGADKYLTYTKLDAEGKPLWIRDARSNLVMQYIAPPVPNNQVIDPVAGFVPCYDIAGNSLFQHSMDAGDRWMLSDAAGQPMLAWDSREHTFHYDYDALHRLAGSFVKGADPADANLIIQFDKTIYGDTPGNGLSEPKSLNLRGRIYQHFDTAGLITNIEHNPATGTDEAFDFKGNSLRSTRRLIGDYQTTPDWSQNPVLETEIFTGSTRYDALNRPIQMTAPHSDRPGARFNIIRPGYNEAGLLERMDVWLEQSAEPADLLDPATANLKAVTNIDYDAKGQRIRIEYNEAGHPIITEYTYEKTTFRLSRLVTKRPKHPETEKRILQDLSYTYDPIGNITDIHDAAQQTVFFSNTRIEPSNSYEYDALYRLIHAEGREHAAQNNIQRDAKDFNPIIGIPFPNSPEALQRYSENYEYDPVGNILGMHHTGGETERWVRWYQYALNSNRLLATRLPGETGKLPFYTGAPGYQGKYSYDSHGNMTAMPHLSLMQWDFRDQLQASAQQVVNNGTPETTWYVYDGAGQRIRKVTERQAAAGQTPIRAKERIYLSGFEIYREYGNDGDTVMLERETLHIMDDKQRIALVETRTIDTAGTDSAPQQLVRFQFGNHLGSASLELGDQAQIISYEEYSPYGSTSYQAMRSQTETPKRYRYTGMERDEETGMSYHCARYHLPWLGRWSSCDPIGIKVGLNLYEYVGANPIKLVDTNGTEGHSYFAEIYEAQLNAIKEQIGRTEAILNRDANAEIKARRVLAGLMSEKKQNQKKIEAAQNEIAEKLQDIEEKKNQLAVLKEMAYQTDQLRIAAKRPDWFPDPPSQIIGAIAGQFTSAVGVPKYYVKTEVSRQAMIDAQTGVEYFEARDKYNAAKANIALSRINEETIRYFGAVMELSGALMNFGSVLRRSANINSSGNGGNPPVRPPGGIPPGTGDDDSGGSAPGGSSTGGGKSPSPGTALQRQVPKTGAVQRTLNTIRYAVNSLKRANEKLQDVQRGIYVWWKFLFKKNKK